MSGVLEAAEGTASERWSQRARKMRGDDMKRSQAVAS
jgi:hypothetical protein